MKTTTIITILFLFLKSIYTLAQTNENKFNIKVKVKTSEGDSTGILINFTKNGLPYKTINSEGINYFVDLDFNSDYVIQCSKKGYLTKAVFFDTHIPNGREKGTFAKFSVRVNLFQLNGVSADSVIPTGGVCYLPEIRDFDVCKDTVQSKGGYYLIPFQYKHATTDSLVKTVIDIRINGAIGQFENFDKQNKFSAIMDGSFELKTASLKVVNKRGKVDKINKVISFLVFAYDMQMKPAIGIDGVEISMIINTGATFEEFFYKVIYNNLPKGSFYIVSNSIYVCPEGKEYLDENIFRVPDLKLTVVKQ